MAKVNPFRIGGEAIRAGERASLAIPLPQQFSCVPVYMPVKVIHGKKPGPCMLITAAMCGDEVTGTEIVNRLYQHSALKHVHGTVILVPAVNVYGIMNRTRFLPSGELLDEHFPGSEHGTLAARICYLIDTMLFSQADYAIDLKTGSLNHTNLPQVFAALDDPQCTELANAFLVPVVSGVEIEPGSYRELAYKYNTPLLVYEAGEALRSDEHTIKVGVRGIINVMRLLNILKEAPAFPKKIQQFVAYSSSWVRAPCSGMARVKCRLGDQVSQGDVLAVVDDPFADGIQQTIVAPHEGVVVSRNTLPLVHEGDTLVQVAAFKRMDEASSHLMTWRKNRDDLSQIDMIKHD
jgi:predicted deacylase